MNALILEVNYLVASSKSHAPLALKMIACLYIFQFTNNLSGYVFNILGIHPRTPLGCIGILFSPFLHASWNHLFYNSVPLFIFITLLLSNGWNLFISISLSIMLTSGSLIWLVGRRGVHIGASALIMGYWGYLLSAAYHQPGVHSWVLAGVCLYYFGGLVMNLAPSEKGVSWEGHLCGCIGGIITAWFQIEYLLLNAI